MLINWHFPLYLLPAARKYGQEALVSASQMRSSVGFVRRFHSPPLIGEFAFARFLRQSFSGFFADSAFLNAWKYTANENDEGSES